MPLTRDEIVAKLIEAGEYEVLDGAPGKEDDYFDVAQFRFHGPDGVEADFSGLTSYFDSVRAAFDNLSISRGLIVIERPHVACQTQIAGTFARDFTQSPAGRLPPNGKHLVWDLINIFRLDDDGRIVEEWIQTDNRSFLRLLGAPEGSQAS